MKFSKFCLSILDFIIIERRCSSNYPRSANKLLTCWLIGESSDHGITVAYFPQPDKRTLMAGHFACIYCAGFNCFQWEAVGNVAHCSIFIKQKRVCEVPWQ